MSQLSDDAIQRMSQVLTTEHFTLQGARSGTISESNGRLGAFLNAVSMSIVALAFVAQISALGPVFLVFSVVIFPILLCLGMATLIRLTQLGVENILLVQAINRIRHYYLEVAPEAEPFFSYPGFDDAEAVRAASLPVSLPVEGFGSAGFQVAVINSFLLGAFAGILAAALAHITATLAVGIGIAGMILGFVLQGIYGAFIGRRVEASLEVRFPSKPSTDR